MNEEQEQELLWKASFVQKQMQEIEEQAQLIDQETQELKDFSEHLETLEKTQQKEILASLGKGIHVKADLKSKELWVEVGSGVVVKKSSKETREIITRQIKKMDDAKKQLASKLEVYASLLQEMVHELQPGHSSEIKKL